MVTATVEVETVKRLVVQATDSELAMLKAMMQNAFEEDENPVCTDIRFKIFKAIEGAQ